MFYILPMCLLLANAQSYDSAVKKLDWWENGVMYQVYVRSFMDSDGDGIGDLNGLTTSLEYLHELGINAILLSPIFKSPMHDYGYDTSDFYSIQSEYGSMEDYEHLLRKADSMNMKVILDIVPNHTSNESDWFLRSANKEEYYTDWYIWANGHIENNIKTPPNNWISVFGNSAWDYVANRDQFYLHQFGEPQPDLNYRNLVVVDEMKNVIKFWLEKGTGGMRFVAMNHIFEVDKELFGGFYPNEPKSGKPGLKPEDYDFLVHVYTKDQDDTYEVASQFRDVFDAVSVRDNITRVMLIEASTSVKYGVRFYGEGHRSGAHISVNFALLENIDKESDARDLKYVTDLWLTYKPLKTSASWISGNHDKSRIASRFRPGLVDAFNMLVLLLPGVAMTYMGEELGMSNGFIPWTKTKDPRACNTDDPVNYVDVSRDPSRTPFQWNGGKNAGFSNGPSPWLPIADGYEHLNVAMERSALRSHYQIYRTLMNLRIRPAFKIGHYESLALNNKVFAFKRWHKDDTYVIVMNIARTLSVVNLTAFDLVFGLMVVEASSVLSSRSLNEMIPVTNLDLAADEALVLRMQV